MALPTLRAAGASSSSVTAPLTTYDGTNIAEDITDVISLISPADTPVYSTVRKTSADGPIINWIQDALRAPVNNAAIEGGAITASTQAKPGIGQTNVQLFDETAEVSTTARASKFYGTGDQMAYQEMKRGLELKRDIERAFVGIHQDAVVGDTSTARKMKSLSYLIASGGRSGGSGATSGFGGTARDLTETILLAAHQAAYIAGADPNWLLVSPVDAAKVANFAYVSPIAGASNQPGTRQRTVGEGTLYNKVETYISPYGTMSVVTDRFCAGAVAESDDSAADAGDGAAYLIDTDSLFVAELQPMQSIPLAKTTHADRKLIYTELALAVENDRACAVITDLNIA
jgi:hypothetical protein